MTLAKEIVQEQIYLGLPNLVTEVQEIWQKICILDMCTEDVTEDEFEDAITIHHLKVLKEDMDYKEKCRDLVNTDMRKPQKFIQNSRLEEACIGMRIQTYMIKCAGNIRRLYKGREECIMCAIAPDEQGPNQRETQEPMEICVGYKKLRSRRDLSCFQDKIHYFTEALKIRELDELQKKKN